MSAYRAVVQLTGFPRDAARKSPSKAVPSPSQLPRDRIQPVQASIHSISFGPCALSRSPHHKQLLTSQNFSRLSTCIDQHLHLKLTNTASITIPADASWARLHVAHGLSHADGDHHQSVGRCFRLITSGSVHLLPRHSSIVDDEIACHCHCQYHHLHALRDNTGNIS
jgi:hypothetical protein